MEFFDVLTINFCLLQLSPYHEDVKAQVCRYVHCVFIFHRNLKTITSLMTTYIAV